MFNTKILRTPNFFLYSILIFFIISKILFLLYENNVWWDAAVYIGMGKYIFSLGDAGFWEASRPIVWPIILGFLWKINLDVIFHGKILSLLFSLGVLILTYLIAKQIFDKKIALISIILLTLSSTFYLFSTLMLTGIVSTFFILLGIYLFLEKKFLLSGIFFGLGFMTRFLQLSLFILILILFLIYSRKGKSLIRNTISLIIGFSLPVVPYLTINSFLYGNVLHPFSFQLFLSQNSGWPRFEPLSFYFIQLFMESFLYVFAILGLFLLFRKLNFQKSIVVYSFLVLFIFFNIIKQKEMRFLLMLFPFLAILVSYGIVKFFEHIKRLKLVLILLVSIIFISNSLINIYIAEKTEIEKQNNFLELQTYLNNENLGNIWISSPIMAAHSNKKIDMLIYYPIFNEERFDFLGSELSEANTLFIDTCDILCVPDDLQCPKESKAFLSKVKNQFKTVFKIEYNDCSQYVFSNLS